MLKYSIFLLFSIIIGVSLTQKDEKDLVKISISTGALRGRKLVTAKNNTAVVFRGIPFAEPPVGDLRYRAPVPKKKWDGELDATNFRAACIGTINALPSWATMDEDCLFINMHTTENCLREKNCPVLYYIFGGGWVFNSPFTLDDDVLIENYNSKDIIVIIITYRMNSFGFFNTGKRTSAVKNLGILDMILGLEWTQREIHNFGGDKNRVSIMGHSSGAMATELISLSPKTDGLFHQVIPMSGPAGMQDLRAENNVEASRALAVKAGCATEELWDAGDSFENIISCLRGKSADELIAAQDLLQLENGQQVAGPALDEPDGILPENVDALLLKRRPYRMLIGTTDAEFTISRNILDEDHNINRPLLFASCVMLAKQRGFKRPIAVGQACADDYFKRPLDIPDLMDDLLIYLPTYDSGETMRRKGATVYKYSFEYDDIGGATGVVFKEPGQKSPPHSEDLVYVVGILKINFTEKDEKIQQIYGGMFADFIKTGDPSPPNYDKWEPTDDRNNYFKIDFIGNERMPGNTNGYHANAVKFWKKTALEVDQNPSKWDDGSFDYKKLVQDLISGLKELGEKFGPQIEEEIEKLKDGSKDWDEEDVDRLKKILNDLMDRFLERDDNKQKRNAKNQGQRTIVDQQVKQMVRQILPSVRETTTVGAKGADWRMWFWVVTGISILLAALLLLTCCSNCHYHSKRRQYERMTEATGLNPSSVKTYG